MFDEVVTEVVNQSQFKVPELCILIAAFVVAFILAFSVGANDVSNSFGTSVGSRVLTVTQACILATIFEVAGATLLGYSVCDTFNKDMYDVTEYKNSQNMLALGALACLIGSAAWNMIATALKMPISGTHSIVGATIGFTIVLKGWDSVRWLKIGKIIASWFASPLLSGLISSMIYLVISKTIIRKMDPLRYGIKALPLFYGATIFINVASIVFKGPEILGLDKLSWYTSLLISLVAASGTICAVALLMAPKLRREILDEIITKTSSNRSNGSSTCGGRGDDDRPKRPKPPLRFETTSLSTKGKEEFAFDNVTFKPDTLAKDDGQVQVPPQSTAALVAELPLDPNRLAEQASPSGAVLGAPTKPTIAPKPIHLQLKRQQAQDNQQLEEIDLGAPTVRQGRFGCPNEDDVESGQVVTIPGGGTDTGGGGGGGRPPNGRPGMIRGERLEVFRLFSSLQILTACFASFAHGTNDVSNAVAPLIPIWNIFYSTSRQEKTEIQTPIWILLFGGIGICTGLWAWGRAVMSTVGDGLTQLTPSKGFSIELGAAISVLTATKFGLPISTTHCKVGSVVIVSLISSKYCSQDNLLDMSEAEQASESNKKAVDWKLFGNIAITWIVTVPLAAAASALVTVVLEWLLISV